MKWKVIFHFVDIGRIIDHHCLNFLFIVVYCYEGAIRLTNSFIFDIYLFHIFHILTSFEGSLEEEFLPSSFSFIFFFFLVLIYFIVTDKFLISELVWLNGWRIHCRWKSSYVEVWQLEKILMIRSKSTWGVKRNRVKPVSIEPWINRKLA